MLAAPRNIRFYEGYEVVALSSTRERLCIIRLLIRVPVRSSAGVPEALTGKITSVWTSKLDFIGLNHVDKKQHFLSSFL